MFANSMILFRIQEKVEKRLGRLFGTGKSVGGVWVKLHWNHEKVEFLLIFREIDRKCYECKHKLRSYPLLAKAVKGRLSVYVQQIARFDLPVLLTHQIIVFDTIKIILVGIWALIYKNSGIASIYISLKIGGSLMCHIEKCRYHL